MEQWFSSDPHFDHENIITFCDRPFADTKEMNDALIANHNALVKPEDHWTCLGDITMIRGGRAQVERLKGWISQLNGHKRLIMGNHDHFPVEAYLEAGFEKVMAMNMYDNMRFTHIPIHPSSMGQAMANIHGHIHNQESPDPVVVEGMTGRFFRPYINISMEVIDYKPVTLGQIKEMVQARILRAQEYDAR